MEQKRFRDYLYKSFYQIKHYGKDDISVISNIVNALYKCAVVSNQSIQKELWDFNNYILEEVDIQILPSMDYDYLKAIMVKFANTTDEKLNWA
ncbi:DUF2254 domain-containing protein [Oceanobacillus kimchii]|uniref:DUF2254 domain-containing protein n=1 Tax=Oceanobacillus kimchii TaxID=746691 RepID=UPI001FCB56AE|nr:DUF2254 domain-containing protein [Oceanobacillus kimchii]